MKIWWSGTWTTQGEHHCVGSTAMISRGDNWGWGESRMYSGRRKRWVWVMGSGQALAVGLEFVLLKLLFQRLPWEASWSLGGAVPQTYIQQVGCGGYKVFCPHFLVAPAPSVSHQSALARFPSVEDSLTPTDSWRQPLLITAHSESRKAESFWSI